MPPPRNRKKSLLQLYDDDGVITDDILANGGNKRQHINSYMNLKGSKTHLDDRHIAYDRNYSNCGNKGNMKPTQNLPQTNKPNKYSNRFANKISINDPNEPHHFTRQQHTNRIVCNEIIDINRLNILLSNAQIQLLSHIQHTTDSRHNTQTAVFQISTANKTNKVGRYATAYCSVCKATLCEQLLHENIEVELDEDNVTVNTLDIQMAIACQESRQKILGLNMMDFILGLPYANNNQFWRYIHSVCFAQHLQLNVSLHIDATAS